MSGLWGKTNIAAVGSGSDLNFSVVGGTSLPQSKEHLVWVKTDVPITSWVVSPNEPQAPAEGMVWILDGDSNGINILRKNAVEVFPSGCRQYIGGAWESLDAFLFRAGSWIAFSSAKLYLYDSSATDTQCTGITGGWAAKAWKPGNYSTYTKVPELNMTNDLIASIDTAATGGAVYAKNSINFDGHKALVAVIKSASVGSNSWGAVRLAVVNSLSATYSIDGNALADVEVINGNGTNHDYTLNNLTIRLPVDGITGSRPFLISIYSTASVEIEQIWFED